MAVRIPKTKIIQLAEENVGRGSELDTKCDDRLNLIVDQLYENYKWPLIRTQGAVTLSGNTWTVPVDYLKSNILTLQIPGSSPAITFEVPLIDYDDYALISTKENLGQPVRASIRRYIDSTGAIQLAGYNWPKANQTYTGTLYYDAIQDYDVADASAPAFLDLMSLTMLLTNELRAMGYGLETGQYDPGMLEKIIERMRRNMPDEGIYPSRAKLDRRLFRKVFRRIWPVDWGGN